VIQAGLMRPSLYTSWSLRFGARVLRHTESTMNP
jgi:hypothetical protein